MENWKAIAGYEEHYQVSNLGRVKSLPREWVWGYGAIRRRGELILSPGRKSDGYLSINLVRNGICKNVIIHRLVAKAFLPNPENKREVNHKNGNKGDNRLENLEWCTREENQQHAYATNLHKRTKAVCAASCRRRFSKPVIQLSKDGNELRVFPSENEASRITGVDQRNMNACIHGRAKSAGGFIWKRA